jgi:hypothetical protein
VPYYLCKDDGSINDDGSFLIDERFDGGDSVIPANLCPKMEKCCKKENLAINITNPEISTEQPQGN